MMQKELTLNTYQKQYLKALHQQPIKELANGWKYRDFIPFNGIIAFGWTASNLLFIGNSDSYQIIDVNTLEVKIKNNTFNYTIDNHLDVFIPEIDEKVRVFGIYSGNGKSISNDGWELKTFYHNWPNSVIGIQEPIDYLNLDRPRKEIWERYQLIQLHLLEYFDLYYAFSWDESFFVIQGSSGIELYEREI